MLHACVRRFDVTGTVQKILGTKQTSAHAYVVTFWNATSIVLYLRSSVVVVVPCKTLASSPCVCAALMPKLKMPAGHANRSIF